MKFRIYSKFFLLFILSLSISFCDKDDNKDESREVYGSIAGVSSRWTEISLVEQNGVFTMSTNCFLGSGIRITFPKEPGNYVPTNGSLLKMNMKLNRENKKECRNMTEVPAEFDFGYFNLVSAEDGILRGDFSFRVENPEVRYASCDFIIAY